jgi:hypothetical protein
MNSAVLRGVVVVSAFARIVVLVFVWTGFLCGMAAFADPAVSELDSVRFRLVVGWHRNTLTENRLSP